LLRYRAITTPLEPKTTVRGFLVILVLVWSASSLVSVPMGLYSRLVTATE
jgi:hypothetical protein